MVLLLVQINLCEVKITIKTMHFVIKWNFSLLVQKQFFNQYARFNIFILPFF